MHFRPLFSSTRADYSSEKSCGLSFDIICCLGYKYLCHRNLFHDTHATLFGAVQLIASIARMLGKVGLPLPRNCERPCRLIRHIGQGRKPARPLLLTAELPQEPLEADLAAVIWEGSCAKRRSGDRSKAS